MAQASTVLISGAGTAGLTLAILLKQRGYEPLVVERDKAPRAEGYMMDFFGSGFDVAERMGLADELRAIRYPIDALQFVDSDGKVYTSVPIARVSQALGGKYVYRVQAAGVAVRFGSVVTSLRETAKGVRATFVDGAAADFALVFGADGVHSGVRRLIFGEQRQFERFLGGYVVAFHLKRHKFDIGRALKLHEETDRVAAFYPLDDKRIDATYVFRHDEVQVLPEDRLSFVRKEFKGAGWIAEAMLKAYRAKEPVYFDSLTQIVMPHWHQGRVALLGDACGALTLLAGQGSHLAMAGAYVIARELARHEGDYATAFAAYEAMLKPAITKRQKDAAAMARYFIPSARSWPWLRRLAIKLMFSAPVLPLMFRWFGARSVLQGYE
jgi:2-polyprenyl-6-methoxyphenol hydroxylase-like FAD-dependent oxidoreductase